MNSSEPVGSVRALWRFPVKSMLGEEVEVADLAADGVVGDRVHAVRDKETGKVASAKNPRKWGKLFDFRSIFTEQPLQPSMNNVPPVRITMPDGNHILSDQKEIDLSLSKVNTMS